MELLIQGNNTKNKVGWYIIGLLPPMLLKRAIYTKDLAREK